MRRDGIALLLALGIAVGCTARQEPVKQATLAELREMSPDLEEAKIEEGLDQALQSYRRFLEETPETAMTPEAMRRLADLELEREYGIGGSGVSMKPQEMAAPEPARPVAATASGADEPAGVASGLDGRESDEDFEQRATAELLDISTIGDDSSAVAVPGDGEAPKGPLEAIALYERLISEYPNYEHMDKVLYQMARAYDELGRTEEALKTMERLIDGNPYSEHFDEVQFRRGEYFFTRKRYLDAEEAYSEIIKMGASSSYYELALYKMGWTLYKQEFYEEALQRYIALLDYKVSIGYDFDQAHAEDDEKRVTDTYRVISLSFSNLGGPEAVREYFTTHGNRSYEDRVYSNLGEHYLAKLRYDDAAKTYEAFVELYPFHRESPRFGMRLVDTFIQGGFPKLVLESKRDFASKYGLKSEYWRHFDPQEAPEVLAYLKSNLKDLANHYHAEYQGAEDPEVKQESYREALLWYGDYLESFPADEETPTINYQLADLLLEHEDFGEAAKQYERTAYSYPAHDQSAAAGYAAVYAYREQLGKTEGEEQEAVKRKTVQSSIKFADTFPDHEHAAAILGAAADDLYEMKDFRESIVAAQRVIDDYPNAEAGIRRSAWLVVGHGSFELAEYAAAENGYAQVLMVTPEGDESRSGLVDNLAAAIYKQGEQAKEAHDYRAAADHFLRVRSSAPDSTIRPVAEYDAGASLIELEDWLAAAKVFEEFRSAFPEHELHVEATKQIAFSYRESGRLGRAASEYDRLADETGDPQLRGEALLTAGDLYQESESSDLAFQAYLRYVNEFPTPLEPAIETRLKIAEIHKAADNEMLYHHELEEIVRIDAEAGADRTDRTRTIAGRSALVLAEQTFGEFKAVKLLQPFEESLQQKQQLMDATIAGMGRLVEYEVSEVTAAATYYMAETYFDFSASLMDSERPTDLDAGSLDEYEMALEETAFPFEEKAIGVHEKNLEMLQAGILNDWTGKSLDRLVELVPGRYARNELSVGALGSIADYAYRTPASRKIVAALGNPAVNGKPAPMNPVSLDEIQDPVSLDDIEVDDASLQD